MIYTYRCPVCGREYKDNDSPKKIHICYECGQVDIPLYSANLYELDLKSMDKIVDAELARRKSGDSVKVIYYWKTQEGRVLKLHKMTRAHLKNLQRLIARKIFENTFR